MERRLWDYSFKIAAHCGHLEIVKELIKSGADVNAKSNNSNTALMGAAVYGDLEIIKELINSGADINAKNNINETALDVAKMNKRAEIVYYLERITKK